MDKSTLWAWILAAASAIVLLSNAWDKLVNVVQAAKAPNAKQNEEIKEIQEWRKEVDKRLARGGEHFDAIDASNRVTQLALLALLDHGIDGNNIDQMQHAKEELQTHLINR